MTKRWGEVSFLKGGGEGWEETGGRGKSFAGTLRALVRGYDLWAPGL